MLDRPSAGVRSRSSNSAAGSSSKKAPTAPSWISKVSTRPVSSRNEPRTVDAALTARSSGVPAGKTRMTSPPRTVSASPSSSPESLSPPSPRKAAWMLTRRIGEPPLLVGSLLLLTLALEAAVLWVGIDDLDEGYFAQQATRVLHGQVPYRDFDSLYTPGLLYLHAGLFFVLGGPSLIGLRLVALLGRALVAGLMYGLGRSFARPLWAVVPALFLVIGLDAAPERWEPHPGWLSTAFALLSVWLFPRSALAAGAATGLTFAFKQNTGVLILGAGLLFAWLTRGSGRTWPGGAVRFAGAFSVVTLAWLLPLLVAIDGQ